MTSEELQRLKEEMEVETEAMRDEILFVIQMGGRRYNLYDGSLSEAPSPKGYFSAEAFLCDLEEEMKKDRHFTVIVKVDE